MSMPLQTFVRGNLVVCSYTFTPTDSGSSATPSSASLLLSFLDTTGARATATVALSLTAGVWTGQWDSSACCGGRVDYWVRCAGDLVAADEGSFTVATNSASAP
jgi:hypothetical protein